MRRNYLRQMIGRVALLLVLFASPGLAVQPDEILKDPVLEARARSLSAGLRCLVCQNQSIDDSDAPLAKDLRVLIRERLKGGDTDNQVVDYIVVRYGDFVLLKPRFNAQTWILWLSPFVILLAALVFLFRHRKANVSSRETALTASEKAELDRISNN